VKFFVPYVLFGLFWLLFKGGLKIKFFHIVISGIFYLGSPPVFENDHFRYMWEGKVVASGNNPYVEAPNSRKLDQINFKQRKKIAYNKLTSIYPPLAQLYFSLFSPFNYKVSLFLMQAFGLLMIMVFLYYQYYKKLYSFILITPFLFKEFIQSVHLDLLAVFVLWILWEKKHLYSSVVFSFLIKLLGILILPFIIINEYFKGKTSYTKIAFSIFVFSSVAVIYQYGQTSDQIAGTEAFVTFWFWNSLIGKPLYLLGMAEDFLRLGLMGSFIITYIAHLGLHFKLRGQKTELVIANCFFCLYLFSPVLHSWYLLWPLVFIPRNSKYQIFLYLSVISYYPYAGSLFSGYLEGFMELVQLIILGRIITMNLISITKEDIAF
jgi:alpha-1,6-mannosyltransferase